MTKIALDAAAAQALLLLSQNVIKVATQLKARPPAAPPAADPTQLEKAASVLVEYKWITPAQKAAAVIKLGEPGAALDTLIDLVRAKAARDGSDPRLAAGHAVSGTNGHPPGPLNGHAKQALDGGRYTGESAADRWFLDLQLSRRTAG